MIVSFSYLAEASLVTQKIRARVGTDRAAERSDCWTRVMFRGA